ncbi:MAG: GGDEF domain-containing protein [Roseateles sp.]|uniref:GGDEF domain-containing protein n=1 Tax=Roseateles sp. TaxID=1971397 RepID=UPI0039E8E59F
MQLDPASTFVIATIVHVLMAALLGLFWRNVRRGGAAGFGWWVCNEALLACGVLVLVVGPVPMVTNAVFITGMPLLELGLRVWFGRRLWPGMGLRWAVAGLGFAAWLAAWRLGMDYGTRAAIVISVQLLQSVLLTQFVYAQWRRLRGADEPSRLGLALLGLGGVAVAVMQLWRGLQNWPYVGTGVAPPGQLLAVLMVVNIALAVTRVSAMLLMLHGRVEGRLQQAGAELERRANTDALTQVASRAHFEAACGVLLAQSRASRLPVCLMLCDMDGFKAVNDELGHPEGDALLVRFAAQLRDTLRQGDLAGRLGGDEFAVLMFNCPLETAQGIAQRLRMAVGMLDGGGGRSMSFSAGLVPARPGEDFAALYRRADQALYAAKSAGRDRVVAQA